MNFNVYLNKSVGARVTKMAKTLHRSRNSIIAEATEEWLASHSQAQWPKGFFQFEPIEDAPDFKQFRSDLMEEISEDPLQ